MPIYLITGYLPRNMYIFHESEQDPSFLVSLPAVVRSQRHVPTFPLLLSSFPASAERHKTDRRSSL